MSTLTVWERLQPKRRTLTTLRKGAMRLENTMTGGRSGDEDKMAGDSRGMVKGRGVEVHVS